MPKLSGAALSAVLLASTFAVSTAKADVDLTISDGNSADTYTLSSPSATAPVDATLTLPSQQTMGGVIVNSASGSALSSPFDTSLQLNSLSVSSGSGGTVTISLSANNFQEPTGPLGIQELLAATQLTPGSSIDLQSYIDSTNQLFGTQQSGPDLTLTNVNAQGISGTTPANFSAPFSLTEVATITLAAGGTAQLNFAGTLTPTPEPASMVLFGTVLTAIGLCTRKYGRSRAQAA